MVEVAIRENEVQEEKMLKVNKERNGCIAHSLFGAIGSKDVEVVFHNL